MYRENENSTRQYSDEYEQQIINRQRTRAAMRRKRIQRQRRILFTSILILVITLIIILCFVIFKPKTNKNFGELNGVWKYDEYTQYEFNKNGEGCMCLDEVRYKYTYSISGDKLTLDFADDAVHDCTYSYAVNENKLTLVGEDGTVGGTYKLIKQ